MALQQMKTLDFVNIEIIAYVSQPLEEVETVYYLKIPFPYGLTCTISPLRIDIII